MAIFALLSGELPPRHLPDINPDSSLVETRSAIKAAFKESGESAYRLSYEGEPIFDDAARLGDYGVPEEALITVERA
jgi:hypothetical protein